MFLPLLVGKKLAIHCFTIWTFQLPRGIWRKSAEVNLGDAFHWPTPFRERRLYEPAFSVGNKQVASEGVQPADPVPHTRPFFRAAEKGLQMTGAQATQSDHSTGEEISTSLHTGPDSICDRATFLTNAEAFILGKGKRLLEHIDFS